jgi:glycosyltransferase involved in cell wall biosynthesis
VTAAAGDARGRAATARRALTVRRAADKVAGGRGVGCPGGAMPSMSPSVSIVVRTKDRPRLVERALASVAAQTYRPIDVVVVNDGGVALDRERLVAALAGVRLALIELPHSGGRAHAANVGLQAADGDLVGFLDDDDELLPGHVAALVPHAGRSGVGAVYSDCEMVRRELGPDGEIVSEASAGRFFLSRDFSAEVLLLENYIPLICVLFTREALASTTGFDERLELFEDWDLYLQVARRFAFHHVPEVTARYVQWSASSQVAFSGAIDGGAEYLQVLAKNLDRVRPETILAYYRTRQGDARAADERRRALEAEVARLADRAAAAERRADAEARGRAQAEAETAQLRARLGEAARTLQSIVDSRAWKLVTFYRGGVKERLLPAGSRRRALYNRLVRPGDARPAPGDAGAGAAPPPQPPVRRVVRERFLAPAGPAEAAAALDARISVVIPTLDAGPELRVVFERLRGQHGIPPVEIIAVDSGSTDGTVELCRRFGATVIPYPGGEFNHGVARNAGARLATGELLVFMSQDAIPVGTDALAGFARALRSDPRMAAASGRQVPRSDADLFTCWQLWCYRERVLGYRADTVVGVEPGELEALGPAERHRAAQLDNVFACVRRDVFEMLRFRPRAIAEDLDLGLRLLAGGHRIGFLSSVAAVHSHSRPPAYHLRRSFVEWVALVDLLGYPSRAWPDEGGAPAAAGVAAARWLYGRVSDALAAVERLGAAPPAAALARARDTVAHDAAPARAAADASLDAVLAALAAATGANTAPAPATAALMRAAFLDALRSLEAFVAARPASAETAGEVRTALLKLCGDTIGHCLADLAIVDGRRHPGGAALAALSTAVGRGV